MKLLTGFLLILFLSACHANNTSKLILRDKDHNYSVWTADEMQKEIAAKQLYRSMHSSAHLIRLKGKESPHYHDQHDLSVSLLSGRSIIHFEEREVLMIPGDVVFIPQGTYHWAENIDPSASVVFAVFSPAFSGKDKRLAE